MGCARGVAVKALVLVSYGSYLTNKETKIYFLFANYVFYCGRLTKQMNARRSEQVAVENELRIHSREAELTVE